MTENDNKHRLIIGRRLAEIRQDRGYSIRELADMSGVNYANICKIENGRYNVSIDILTKITEALKAELRIVTQ